MASNSWNLVHRKKMPPPAVGRHDGFGAAGHSSAAWVRHQDGEGDTLLLMSLPPPRPEFPAGMEMV